MRAETKRNEFPRVGSVVLLIGLALVAAACGGVTAGGGSSSGGRFNTLLGDEIRTQSQADNLYDALMDVRGQWLRPRPRTSITFERAEELVVYVNGSRDGELGRLRVIDVEDVNEVQYLDPLDATTRYGTGHGGGVISVDLTRF